jgi:hypothetical protein
LLLITRPTSVEKFEEKLVQTVPSQILRVTSATRSRPRATSCAWPRQAAPPADRARLSEHRCDRQSQGFRTDVRTQSSLSTRRTLTGRAEPTCAASQRRRRRTRAAPPLGGYWPSRLATALPMPWPTMR